MSDEDLKPEDIEYEFLAKFGSVLLFPLMFVLDSDFKMALYSVVKEKLPLVAIAPHSARSSDMWRIYSGLTNRRTELDMEPDVPDELAIWKKASKARSTPLNWTSVFTRLRQLSSSPGPQAAFLPPPFARPASNGALRRSIPPTFPTSFVLLVLSRVPSRRSTSMEALNSMDCWLSLPPGIWYK